MLFVGFYWFLGSCFSFLLTFFWALLLFVSWFFLSLKKGFFLMRPRKEGINDIAKRFCAKSS